MPVVRDSVSALDEPAYAAHARLPAAGSPPRGEALRASRAVPAVRVRSPELEAEGPYAHGGVEPPLAQVLRDPIVRARMRCDGVEPDEVRRLLEAARRR